MKRTRIIHLSAVVVGLWAGGGLTARAGAEQAFEELRKQVSSSVATASETAVLSLLDAGMAEHKPTQASALAERWLRDNVAADAKLLYKAGRAAELSGDWRAAASLYRQYLKRADLKSPIASDAIVGTYTLLIHHLDDEESAYAFARAEGHALVASPQARQFDPWFLDQATHRGDAAAVAARLRALLEAKVPDHLLAAHYERYFHWLLQAVVDWRYDAPRMSPQFIKNVKTLAKAMTFNEELARRLDWEISVSSYNMNLVDGVQANPPVAEAQALLVRYPHYAQRVQTGWAGGRRSRHYRDDQRKYWPVELEKKLAPVTTAVSKLSPAEQVRFYRTYSHWYYDGGPQVVPASDAKAFVLANPQLVNSRLAPDLSFGWNLLPAADATELAPHLKLNPSADAALIRAIVAAGEKKDFAKAVDALLQDEAWRLSTRHLDGGLAGRLWHWAGRPGGNAARDQAIARSKDVAKAARVVQVKKEDPAAKRLAAFKKLWQDYMSPSPKIPAVRERLMRVLRITPEALPELIADARLEAHDLAREALEAGIDASGEGWNAYETANRVATGHYSPCFDELVRRHYGGLSRLKNDKSGKYRPHPLATMFHEQLAGRLKQDKVEPWLVYAWLNTQFPEDNGASVKLMDALRQSSVWAKLPYDLRYGARVWFGKVVLPPAQQTLVDAADSQLICKPLLTLPGEADVAAAVDALTKTLDGLRASPVWRQVEGLDRLASLDDGVLDDPQVSALLLEIISARRTFTADAAFGERLLRWVEKKRPADVLHEYAPYLWRYTEVYHRPLGRMLDMADRLVEAHPSAAQAWARCGLQTIARHRRGHTYYNRDVDIPRLKTARGKATMAMGLIDIPVPPSHPAYAIYKSQGEYAVGNEDSARELYLEHADQLLPVHRKLSVPYLLWVLQYTIDQRDEVRQEELAKALMAWMQQSPGAFTLDQRVALEIAYGDIALQRGMLPEAHKIYSRIRTNKAYETVFARHTATLRRVLVDRISGDYDGALETLLELDALKIPRLTTASHHARAEVHYAMEDYEKAAEEIAKVLERDPDHADATILRGRVQLKLQRLIEATEVELGAATAQDTLVPGEMLKVTLNDPTLSVSSGGSDIEVVVWADSGDREHLLLRQFGDQKTKYRGELRTALGAPASDDRTLQIIGDDKIYYAYSENFRKKMPGLEEHRGGPITVASDAIMMASARRLLTENEQRVADMRAATELLEGEYRRYAQNTDPQRLAQIRAEAAARARRARLEARVKPGNPIHLRVVDPDRGRTAGVDELAVTVASSSGDVIGQVILEETGTHTGRFEGTVTTAAAHALASASSTETGRNPNMVISPKTDYPAWRPVASTNAQHSFTVDLNDNTPLGALAITAADKGYALKRFLVQTAMNRGDWTTVATYPASRMMVKQPWQPSVSVVNEEGRRAHYGARSVYKFADLQQHMAVGWLADTKMALAMNVAGPSQAFPASLLKQVEWQRSGRWPNPGVVMRFQAYFHEPVRVQRRFELQLGRHELKAQDKNQRQPAEFLMAVDGRIITSKDSGKLAGELDLRPGLHRLEIWATGWIESIGFGREAKLRANLEEPDELVDCPDSFFDPTTFPPGLLDHRNGAAAIEAGEQGTQFDVTFAPDSRARLVRLVFFDQEGPVPSLNRLTLTDPKGQTHLPVATDYAEQRKNDVLEILSGDRITVRYIDDRFVTKGKQKHERFLDVAYTDGEIEFADVEPRYSSRHGKDMPYHETLLRFPYDKPLSVVIYDADMDTSVQPDRVTCTITSDSGEQREITAEETGPSTGMFRGWITPVAQATQDPKQIQVRGGGTLTAKYRDAENLRPGVPYERLVTIPHAVYAEPRIEVAHMTISPYEPVAQPGEKPRDAWGALNERLDRPEVLNVDPRSEAYQDRIRHRFLITQRFMPSNEAPADGLALVHGRHAYVDVVAPHLALGAAATLPVYVQTDAGRAKAGDLPQDQAFDVSVPGTVRFTGQLGGAPRAHVPERGGYVTTWAGRRGSDYEQAAASRQTGRFRLVIPIITGPPPELSYADPDAIREQRLDYPAGLTARTGDRIHLGVPYTDLEGHRRWATASAKVITQPMLDVMQEDYRQPLTEAHVGETLHLRVVDLAADKTAAPDQVRVYVGSKSGHKHYVLLGETAPNSGVFKGICPLTFASPGANHAEDDQAYDVWRDGLPVTYGDSVGARYTDAAGTQTPAYFVTIAKGSDGTIAPFSKRYDDSDTAMRTQFAMAESFLELAARHSKLGAEEAAEREYARARQLLASVVSQFTDPETRAHAEYLLGNMTMADAQRTEDAQRQEDRYHAALARFMKVTGTYPDTRYASKAQFQAAVVYEKLGQSDIAAQEYVKLAYKYPESEHLATAMARLGSHFQSKAVDLEKQAAALLAQTEDADAQYEGQARQTLARNELIKAAQIFGRLQTRFPDHELAGQAGLRAGRIYFHVERYHDAIRALQSVIENESYDGATLRSHAMYWAGRCHQLLRQPLLAYALFKRITYDFPESRWAAFARAQLSTEQMLRLDHKLEIERLEAGE